MSKGKREQARKTLNDAVVALEKAYSAPPASQEELPRKVLALSKAARETIEAIEQNIEALLAGGDSDPEYMQAALDMLMQYMRPACEANRLRLQAVNQSNLVVAKSIPKQLDRGAIIMP
jgi:hypothetical protein